MQGIQRHQQQIGERDARHDDGRVEFRGFFDESGGLDHDEQRHGGFGDGGERQYDVEQGGKGLFGESAGGFAAFGFQLFGKQRDKSDVERPFGEQAAEQVGQFERDEKRVGDHARAQKIRDQQIADETQHAADHRPAADRQNGFNYRKGSCH